jgi:dihydropteroate synthase
MGVLNRTPDSFSDGGVFMGLGEAVDHGLRMAEAGASIIDVGGESTRPGSLPVPPEVQVERVCPVLERIRARSDVILSVDTTRAAVAEEALRAGADWVNDTSSLADDADLLPLLARARVPVVLMHRPAPPRTMQESPSYEDAPGEVRRWLRARIAFGLRGGLDEHRIVVDPGIGFGKRLQDNLDCLVHLGGLSSLGLPILVGTSRKSFLGSLTGGDVSRRIWGTAATVALASWLGAHLVRVHDVSEMVDVIRVADAMRARARQD